MEKTIFILREYDFFYTDEWHIPICPNTIYKKFATYKEALAEKNRLEIDIIRKSKQGVEAFFMSNFIEKFIQKGKYDHFKDMFGIDWLSIWESSFVDKNKVKQPKLYGIANQFFVNEIMRDDKRILEMLTVIDVEFYKVVEVKENALFYKLYTNPDFNDFYLYGYYDAFREDPIEMGEEVYYIGGGETPSFYFDSLQDIQNTILSRTYYELTFEGKTKNTFKGSFSTLSEAPEILKSYMESYADYFVYDTENQELSINHIHDTEKMYEVMRGFVALLRPEKVPFIIKSFPISEIPEKCIEERQEPSGKSGSGSSIAYTLE